MRLITLHSRATTSVLVLLYPRLGDAIVAPATLQTTNIHDVS